MSKQVETKEQDGLKKLREPFPAHQISKLCKPYSKDSTKGTCKVCGGYHGLPAVSLDYVGHAALTDRLLDSDPAWNWEPVSFGADGYPVIDGNGGMWIKLTVCGVTRLGYGDAQGKTGGNAMKERIGDALRNAAMRFGAALDLWHKGDLHIDEEPVPKNDAEKFAVIASVKGVTPGSGCWEPFNEAERRKLEGIAEEINEAVQFEVKDAVRLFYNNHLTQEEQVAVWSLISSKDRSAIKKAHDTAKAADSIAGQA